jgi:hypothetical protein
MSDELSGGAPAPAEAPVSSTPAPEASTPAPAADTSAETAAALEAALDADLAKTYRKANIGRDESGKFASKDGEQPKPADAVKPEGEQLKPDAAKTEAPKVEPPRSWPKELAEKWANVPPDVQAQIAKREAEAHQTISRLGQVAKAAEPVAKLLNERSSYLQSVGIPPAEFMSRVFDISERMDSGDAIGALRELAAAYKIDVSQLAPNPLDPPELDTLRRENAEMRRVLSSRQHHERATAEQAAAQRDAELTRVVSDVRNGKEHWSEVETELLASIGALKSANPSLSPKELLEQAYDRAVWANPTTRAKLEAQRAEKAERERIDAAKKAGEAAKRAASINVNGRSAPAAEADDLENSLRAVWNKRQSAA